jgi:hypothetical protein
MITLAPHLITMKITFPTLIILFVTGILASCEAGQGNNREQPASVQSPDLQLPAKMDSLPKTTPPTTQQTFPQPQPQVVTNTNTSNAKLNPAHGQPGHRCEIPVGAPLNSAPAAGNTAPVISKPATITQPQQPQQKGTVRLNPAHGQPGHDCNIPVGQPLRS